MNKKTVTVGIAVYNEEKNISKLLDQLSNLSNKLIIQIIVVSSGSTDRTEDIVRKYDDVDLIAENTRKGKTEALKLIISNAKGDFIIFLDGDISLGKDSIDILVNQFKNSSFRAWTGRVKSIKGKSKFMSKLSEIGCLTWHKLRLKEDLHNGFVYPTGYLYAIKKTELEKIKLPGTIINDDGYIGAELAKVGIRFKYVPTSLVHVMFPQNMKDFIKQKIRTRMGRRQLDYGEFSNVVEKNWRKMLINTCTKNYYFTCYIYYTLDLLTRFFAYISFFYPKKNWHIWSQVSSTKFNEDIKD